MFKNYLHIALRNILKQKVISFINTLCLAIGIAISILILLWVQHEFSYDRHYKNAKQIYRILSIDTKTGCYDADVPYRLGSELLNELPEVLKVAHFYNFWGSPTINYGNKMFSEHRFLYSDSTVLDIFDYDFVRGESKTALKSPNSVIMTESMVSKYFGNIDPVGELLTIDHKYKLKVTGVIKGVPDNSHFKFDFLAFIPERLKTTLGFLMEDWDNAFKTYLLLAPNVSPDILEKKFPEFLKRHIGKEEAKDYKFTLQPLTRIHLYSSNVNYELAPQSNIDTVRIISLIAFLILLIACFNYMNLSTARSALRAKEVGVRKAVGANRNQLIKQFLGEAIIISFFGLLLALVIVEIILPTFNQIVNKQLINFYHDWKLLIIVVSLSLFVGIVSGSYPAFFLSSFKVANILKSTSSRDFKQVVFRKLFVVLQFAISISLIIGTILIFNQLRYIQNKNLGFNKDQLVVLDTSSITSHYAFKNELLKHNNIVGVSVASSVPPNPYHFSGAETVGEPEEKYIGVKNFFVDYDYINVLDLEIIEGRSFSENFVIDKDEALIINETTVKELKWKDPIGKRLKCGWNNRIGTVIGVVKDFHFKSLHEKIEPAVIRIEKNSNRYSIVIKIKPTDIQNTLTFIQKTWKKFNPQWPLNYYFVDEQFSQLHQAEQKIGKIVGYFSIIGILIACLGLFGLSSFMIERRTKEIGVRKVLGASIPKLLSILTKDFAKWILIANLIAWPVAYFFTNKWLQNFAYRIAINWWMFILAGMIALVIALLTVSYQSIKAALANPVEALRYE